MASVEDVKPNDDFKKFQDDYNYYLERQAMMNKGPVKKMEDFKVVIADLEKRGQVVPEIDWHREVNNWQRASMSFKGVHYVVYYRDKGELALEVDHDDHISRTLHPPKKEGYYPGGEKRYWITLQGVHELEARDPSNVADITVERSYGGDRTLETRDHYVLDYYENRGICDVSWERKGSHEKGPPHSVEGFRVYCRGMTPIQYYELMRARWKDMAKWSDNCRDDPQKCAKMGWLNDRHCSVDLTDDIGPEADEARRKEKEREEARKKAET